MYEVRNEERREKVREIERERRKKKKDRVLGVYDCFISRCYNKYILDLVIFLQKYM